MCRNKNSKSEKWIITGIPILFLLSPIFHNTYELSGNSIIAGIFFPVNESMWEHLKLAFWPLLLWWFIWYFIKGKKLKINKKNWIVATLVSVVLCTMFIIVFCYTYQGVLGFESTTLDILSLLFGLILGQLVGLNTYRNSKFSKITYIICIIILILLIAIFVIFTFMPPHIPLYQDSITQLYGIGN